MSVTKPNKIVTLDGLKEYNRYQPLKLVGSNIIPRLTYNSDAQDTQNTIIIAPPGDYSVNKPSHCGIFISDKQVFLGRSDQNFYYDYKLNNISIGDGLSQTTDMNNLSELENNISIGFNNTLNSLSTPRKDILIGNDNIIYFSWVTQDGQLSGEIPTTNSRVLLGTHNTEKCPFSYSAPLIASIGTVGDDGKYSHFAIYKGDSLNTDANGKQINSNGISIQPKEGTTSLGQIYFGRDNISIQPSNCPWAIEWSSLEADSLNQIPKQNESTLFETEDTIEYKDSLTSLTIMHQYFWTYNKEEYSAKCVFSGTPNETEQFMTVSGTSIISATIQLKDNNIYIRGLFDHYYWMESTEYNAISNILVQSIKYKEGETT